MRTVHWTEAPSMTAWHVDISVGLIPRNLWKALTNCSLKNVTRSEFLRPQEWQPSNSVTQWWSNTATPTSIPRKAMQASEKVDNLVPEKVLLLTWPGPTDTYTRLRKKSSTPIWTDHEINLGSVLDPFINLTVSYLSLDMQHKLQI